MSGMASTYFALKRSIILTTLIISAALTGCASVKMAAPADDAKAKAFTSSPDQAKFYVYRNEFLGGSIGMEVQVDGKSIGKTGAKTYFAFDLAPGMHSFVSVAENDSLLQIKADAGKIYYIWQEVKMGIMSARSQLKLVDSAQGQAGVKESQLLAAEGLGIQSSGVSTANKSPSDTPQPKQAANLSANQSNPKMPAAVMPAKEPAAAPTPTPVNNGPSTVKIEKVPFEIGVSSYSVERIAKQNSCSSSKGAGLIFKKGTVEVYRVACDDGREIKARCELRQCELFKM